MKTKFNVLNVAIFFVSSILIILAAFLFYQYFFSPKLVYENTFSTDSKTISDFFPNGRANDPEKNLYSGESYQRVSNEPVYFNVALPKFFDKQMFTRAKITLTYQNNRHPLVELGLRKNYTNLNLWSYEMKPIQNRLIDEFEGAKTEINDKIILSKNEKIITKPEEFLANPPVNSRIATYYSNLEPRAQIDEALAQKFTRFTYSLRGSHNFVFYKGNTNADLSFKIADGSLNSVAQIIVRDASKNEIARQNWQEAATIGSNTRQFNFSISGKSGIYFVELQAPETAITSEITTSQRYFVVQNQVRFAQNSMPISMYGDAAELQFLPKNNGGMQTAVIDKQSVPVYDLLERSIWPKKGYADTHNLRHITAVRGDIMVFGDGFFSFNKENYFNPIKLVFPVKHYTTTDDFDYLVAQNYESPIRSKRFYYASATFDLANIVGKTNELEFMLSVPGLYKNKGDVVIYKIQAEFERKPISFSKLRKLF